MSTLTYAVPSAAATPASAQHAAHDDELSPGDISVGVIIGRSSEYFDFFVFGIAAVLVFPAVFFPHFSALHGTLLSFAIFSLAFVARPVGTALSMAIQRRWGRAAKMTIALFTLGAATVGIAFLPGYADLGLGAVAWLVALRLLQGLALGASWDGLPSLLALSAPSEKRGWYAMLGQLGAPLGFLIAAGLFAYLYASLPESEFIAWGWRFPFFVAFAVNVVALFARLQLVLGQSYTEAMQELELKPVSVTRLIDEEGEHVALGAFAALASFALFHLVTVFPLSWLTLYGEQSVVHVLLVQMLGAACATLAIAVSGSLADRLGRRNTLGGMAILIGLFSLFTPMLLNGGAVGSDIFIILGFILLGLSYGQSSGTVTANFSPGYRYTGAALSADMAWLIGAAFAPLVALGLSAKFGLWATALYLLSGALCTLAALGINRALESRQD